ncbi:MAG: ABC transporter ATP-binding protein [Bacteroidetes bacterium HGW-Bacteroidetes-6]|jgi:ABC-2 type transport system ATP-binding protein|nr:MAG: ABC transporter ATP-binding protein [Bacteroidetes bacterium HGW-Bacteroidetes-6]
MNYFEARQVSKAYANHKALDDVSIEVAEQSIFGLLGPNGAGKTTLIRIINQIIGPDTGSLFFQGNPLAPNHTELIGYLPEERGLYKKMKVGEQALYLARLKGLSRDEASRRLKYWFQKFEIESWWNRKVEELSKGMQQKVQFIVTVVHEPPLLIFDEPFSGFDPINAELLKNEILELRKKGSTIIFSTHNMASVEELCDDIALIHKSKVILDGNVGFIKKQYGSDNYLVKMRGACDNTSVALASLGEVKETVSKDDLCVFKIELKQGVDVNDLLKVIMQMGRVIGFEEILPSMNEIFISKVTGNGINKKILA